MTSPFDFVKRWLHGGTRIRQLRKHRQRRQLRLESLETRTLLAGDTLAAIAGTAFTDSTDDGLTADDPRLSSATVQLYRDGGDGVLDRDAGGGDDTLVGSQLTDSSGRYQFNELGEGTYFVEQTAVPGQLQRPGENVHQVVITETDAAGKMGIVIDSFDSTTQTASVTSAVPASDSNSMPASETLGAERDLFVELLSGAGGVELEVNLLDLGLLTFSNKLEAVGRGVVTWDGADNDAEQLDPVGLGGVDLTENGANVGVHYVVLGSEVAGGTLTVHVYTDAGNHSSLSQAIPNTNGAGELSMILRFSDFQVSGGSGADFTNVGAIQLEIQGVPKLDAEFKELGTIGPTVKTQNFANLNPLSVGDAVWRDADNDGQWDEGEAGLANVAMTLYEDTDGNNAFTSGVDLALATDTTDSNGRYRFDDLLPGDYIVRVDAANFDSGGALAGLVSSTGNDPAPDPDDDVDNDDNGYRLEDGSVVAMAVTLTAGGEPTADGDQDLNANLTVDFGFTPISDLLVIKSDDPDPVVAGENLTYTLEVTNQGPSPVTGVIVTDTLPAGVTFVSVAATQGSGSHEDGTVTVNLGSLATGQTVFITIVVTVDASTTGPLVNQAEVTGDNFDPDLLDNSTDEDTGVIQEIDLEITKEGLPNPVVAGQQLTYTLLVTNQGPSDASGVTVTDTLPSGVTYVSATTTQGTVAAAEGTVTVTLGDLDRGADATITILVEVNPSARDELVNLAHVSGNETETNLENNDAEVSTTITPQINLTIAKTDSPDPVLAGNQLTYQLLVTNEGPSDATGVTVTDTLPAGVSFVSGTASQGAVSASAGVVTASLGNMAAGGQATVTLTVAVGSATRDELLNVASVAGTETELDPGDNEAEAETQVNTEIDLSIAKTGSPATAIPGQSLTYTLTVENDGPSDATGVQVVDTLPAGVTFVSATSSQGTVSGSGSTVTADLGTLADGGQATITVLVNVADTASDTLVNEAEVTGNETETDTQNNEALLSTPVEPRINLNITKAGSANSVVAGQQLTYTLIVENEGPSTATGVTVVDTLPAGVSYQSATATQGTIGASGSTVTAAVGQLASGASATFTILVNVDPATRGTITNVATVAGNETETNTDDNDASVETTVQVQLNLTIAKQASPASVQAGSQLTYTLTVENEGPSSATEVTVTDTLPSELSYVSGTSTLGTVSNAGQVVTVNMGNLASGQSATVTLVTQIDSQAGGDITNVAQVTGNETETNNGDNTASAPTTIQELLSSISGSVYVDADNDGQKDAGEQGLSGVVIVLSGTDSEGAAVNRQATTGEDGTFNFADLRRGTYRLTEQQPDGYRDGLDTVGSLAANTDVNDEFSNIQLPAGATATGYLFGERTRTFSKRLFLSSIQFP